MWQASSRSRRGRLAVLLGALALAVPAGALGAEAPCEGDECQGPAPSPEEVIPATAVVEGPANPPVRFPKSSAQKHKPKKHKGNAKHKGAHKQGAR
jgi:hypothetical protein